MHKTWSYSRGNSLLLRVDRRGHHKVECADQVAFQVASSNDRVQHTVLQQKLRPLESFWKLLSNRLLDDARACEAYQGAGLGNIEVPQHSKARGHAARGGV